MLAEAKKLVPNKPVKYVLTTHHHFDHVGGLRTYVAEGATVASVRDALIARGGAHASALARGKARPGRPLCP